jgi:hypothetical protein
LFITSVFERSNNIQNSLTIACCTGRGGIGIFTLFSRNGLFKLFQKALKPPFSRSINLESNKANKYPFNRSVHSFIHSPAIASLVYKSCPAIAVFQMLSLKLKSVVHFGISLTLEFCTHIGLIFSFVSEID